MSDILDIRHFVKGMAIWDRWDNFFLAVQLFRSPLIIVRIESQYSFGSKKNMKKKFSIFWYFSLNVAPYWISYWTKLNFDHGFLKSIPKTIRKHGFRLEIYLFQSWEWGSQIDKRAVEHQIQVLWRQQCAIQKHACRQQAAFCVRIKLLSNGTIGDGGTVAALLRQPVTAHGRQYCGSQ